jgi:hypothetical protein
LKNLPFFSALSTLTIVSADFFKSSAYFEASSVEQMPDSASRFSLLLVFDEGICGSNG